VEDEPTTRIMTEGVLRLLLGCTVYTAENGKEALALALQVMPQIVITDWLMPVMDGIDFCRALRATDWGQSMYVIMLTGVETEEKIVEAFEAGVDDYISKPMNFRALSARMRAALHYVKLLEAWEQDRTQLKQFAAELAISNRRLEHAAMTDLLTGMPNRRAGMEALDKTWGASLRTGQPVAALMIDVDHFKSVNDQYGHAVGDLVLQEVAKGIQAAARKDDSVSRIGGEEFLLVCHNADARTALLAAERLRKMVKALKINIASLEVHVSVSIGVANREKGMLDTDDMVLAADKALYAAKKAGRDRVCLFAQGKTHCA
jgi:diguanylate cyclase (GGDEF)-like protein